MNFKLTRISETDVYFLAAEHAVCLGDVLIVGTFAQVFTFATQLKTDSSVNDGSGDYAEVTNSQLTNVTALKWFLIDVNGLYQMTNLAAIAARGVLMIAKTDGVIKYSFPTNCYATTGTLTEIFTRIHKYVSDLLD